MAAAAACRRGHVSNPLKMNRLSIFNRLAAAMAAIGALTSCGSVFDDLEPCPTGVEMRFLYDINAESANAFPSQVDCLTLHVFDAEGAFVKTFTETSATRLADEGWRLTADLQPGLYHAVAYGGLVCDEASFALENEPAEGSMYGDIRIGILPDHIGRDLHNLFYGSADFSIAGEGTGFTPVSMHMAKATNSFRILLQQTDGNAIDGREFDFEITDANGVLDHSGKPLEGAASIVYPAHWRGSLLAENSKATEQEVPGVGIGEISTSRLFIPTAPRLKITHKPTDRTVMDIPLLPYLLASQTEAEKKKWTSQEFLDRHSRWTMTFFLDKALNWAQTTVIVNGWSVRIDNADL